MPDLNPGFRTRPVEDVVRDVATTRFRSPWADKVAWFWDDNLLVKRRRAKDLLREMSGLGKRWLTQASIDITHDRELLDLMEKSGCIGIFLGIESLDEADLQRANKKQNKVREYVDAIARLHDRGICVMAGFISGFDDQMPESIVKTADRLDAIGVDVPFLSVLTPFRGTPLRSAPRRGTPPRRSRLAVLQRVQRRVHAGEDEPASAPRRAPGAVATRVLALARGVRTLRPGAMLLASAMNGFYGQKQLAGNEPADAPSDATHRIAHPAVGEPNRLVAVRSLVRGPVSSAAGEEPLPLIG